MSEKEFGTPFSFTGPGLKPSCYNKKSKIVLFIELITIIFTSFLHQACDPDIYPNINHLLQIACTIHQSVELTTSKQTVIWRLSKDIYTPPWERKHCHTPLWWTFITKSPLTTMQWFSFLAKDTPQKCFLLIPSLTKHKCSIYLS